MRHIKNFYETWWLSSAVTWRLFIGVICLGMVALTMRYTPEHVVRLTLCDAECMLAYGDPSKVAGSLEEDDSGWDCRTMGNFICGAEHQALQQ